jgi:thiamine kinase-like enzyme
LRLSELEQNDYSAAQHYLAKCGVIAQDEKVTMMRAHRSTKGTVVWIVQTRYHAFALKQSAYLPSANNENEFYRIINKYPYLSRFIPRLYHYDSQQGILIFEAIDEPVSFATIYRTHHLTNEEIEFLSKWLSHLHRLPVKKELRDKLNESSPWSQVEVQMTTFFTSEFMTELRMKRPSEYHHIMEYSHNTCTEISKPENALLHGGFTPDNWINTDAGIYIIDPKQCYVGRPELDLAIFLAHLRLAAVEEKRLSIVFEHYQNKMIDHRLVDRFSGIEMLRCLIMNPPPGISSKTKGLMLEKSQTLILQ